MAPDEIETRHLSRYVAWRSWGGVGRAGKLMAKDRLRCPKCGKRRFHIPRAFVREGHTAMTDPKYMRPGLDFAVGKATEEAGEFLAAIGKTLRWGWFSVNPELAER